MLVLFNPSCLHASIDAPRWAMGIRIVVRRRPAQRWHVPSSARTPANIGLDPDVENCRFTACERGFDLFANILRAFYPYPACPHGLCEQCEVGAQQFTGPCRSKARRELATLAEKAYLHIPKSKQIRCCSRPPRQREGRIPLRWRPCWRASGTHRHPQRQGQVCLGPRVAPPERRRLRTPLRQSRQIAVAFPGLTLSIAGPSSCGARLCRREPQRPPAWPAAVRRSAGPDEWGHRRFHCWIVGPPATLPSTAGSTCANPWSSPWAARNAARPQREAERAQDRCRRRFQPWGDNCGPVRLAS